MQVSRWGDSLAVRLPQSVVEALDLKEGDQVDIRVAGDRGLEIEPSPDRDALLSRLDALRGRVPADFRFDRAEAHERD